MGIDVEYVMKPAGGGLLFGSVVLVHVQFLGEIETALGCVVGFVVEVHQDLPATRFELVTHEKRIVIARPWLVVLLFFDPFERWSRAADLLLTVLLRLDLCVVSDVDQTRITIDLGWRKRRCND